MNISDLFKPPSIKIKFAIVKINIETSAPRDESFVIFTIKSQVIIDKIAGKGLINKKPPKRVATPFPPLNFNHIG